MTQAEFAIITCAFVMFVGIFLAGIRAVIETNDYGLLIALAVGTVAFVFCWFAGGVSVALNEKFKAKSGEKK